MAAFSTGHQTGQDPYLKSSGSRKVVLRLLQASLAQPDGDDLEPRNLRTVRILRRTHHPAIETIAQASDAAMNAIGTLSSTSTKT